MEGASRWYVDLAGGTCRKSDPTRYMFSTFSIVRGRSPTVRILEPAANFTTYSRGVAAIRIVHNSSIVP